MWNFHRSWFLTLKFPRTHKFAEFPGIKAFFLWNFLQSSDKSKISRGDFQKSISSTHSCLDFFWNSPFCSCTLKFIFRIEMVLLLACKQTLPQTCSVFRSLAVTSIQKRKIFPSGKNPSSRFRRISLFQKTQNLNCRCACR